MRKFVVPAVVLLAACGGGSRPEATPAPAVSFTPAQLDSIWARASDLLARRKWQDAIIAFERLQLELPTRDPRRPAARFSIAEARLGEKSHLQAVREFRRVADDFAADSLAPEALKRAGDAYSRLWRRPELDPTYGMQAMATYQEVVQRFPASPAAEAAKVRIAELREMFAVKQYKAAQFYIRYNLHDSAILYLKDLVATYPDAEVTPLALERLIETYDRLGYVEEVTESCNYFRRFHPEAPNLGDACPAPARDPAEGVG